MLGMWLLSVEREDRQLIDESPAVVIAARVSPAHLPGKGAADDAGDQPVAAFVAGDDRGGGCWVQFMDVD